MKTIKEPNSEWPPMDWWVGQRAKCNRCTKTIEFEKGDDDLASSGVRTHGYQRLTFKCSCDNHFSIEWENGVLAGFLIDVAPRST